MVKEFYVGIDYGERRLGLAKSVDGERAQAWQTLSLAHPSQGPKRVAEVLSRGGEAATAVIVGLPRNLEGDDTDQTRRVRDFAVQLAKLIGGPVELQDEAATSSLAKQRLEDRGVKYGREDIDAAAAAIILQDYLDAL